MELYLVIAIVAIIVMAVVGYFVGNRGKKGYVLTIGNLENNIKELGDKIAGKESELAEKVNAIMTLTSERDVQKTNADNYFKTASHLYLARRRSGASQQGRDTRCLR